MKGGKINKDGKLDKHNFNNNRQNVEIELQEYNNVRFHPKIKKTNIKFKILEQKRTEEPFFFTAFDEETGKYRYVFYNDTRIFTSDDKGIRCSKLNDDGSIVELTHEDILLIKKKDLKDFSIQFLKLRKTNPEFMKRLNAYCEHFIFPIVLN